MKSLRLSREEIRKPHASLDLLSRRLKARKIERLLGLEDGHESLRLLEVGSGSGGISHYFGTHPDRQYQVSAVDVADNRVSAEGFAFTHVSGTSLPFEDGSFDVVVSNHVMEHVGGSSAQTEHLNELRRVLQWDGVGYLAIPSRWALIEPHYRLAFLSWLPPRHRGWWLRLWRRGDNYDCRPLSRGQMETLLRSAGLSFEQLHGTAIRATYELERPDAALYRLLLRHIPNWIFASLRGLMPTLIYRVRVARSAPGGAHMPRRPLSGSWHD